jgi:hypothetical protein
MILNIRTNIINPMTILGLVAGMHKTDKMDIRRPVRPRWIFLVEFNILANR